MSKRTYSKLRGLRAEKGISIKHISKFLGISETTYRRKEHRYEDSDFELHEAKKISELLQTPVSTIFQLCQED